MIIEFNFIKIFIELIKNWKNWYFKILQKKKKIIFNLKKMENSKNKKNKSIEINEIICGLHGP